MAELLADENFPFGAVVELRRLGHDVLRVEEVGLANRRIPDPDILAFAISQQRAVVTHNRRHYIKLHSRTPTHFGIVCTQDVDFQALALRIHQALLNAPVLVNQLIRVNLPSP
jgi:predicted nuclease of predicted toxin-antitoxin system